MPPEDARLEDARAWLAKAELDLRAADLEVGAPQAALWGDVAFHAQQAAEKALKALLALHDEPFRKTHSIEELGRACTPRPRTHVERSMTTGMRKRSDSKAWEERAERPSPRAAPSGMAPGSAR